MQGHPRAAFDAGFLTTPTFAGVLRPGTETMAPQTPRSPLPVTAALLASACAGCALQATNGWATGQKDAAPRVVTLETRLRDARRSGPYLGLGGTLAIEDAKRPLHVRSGSLSAGYHHCGFRVLAGEVGGELGIGEPLGRAFPAPGFYAGVGGTMLVRVWGDRDGERVYQILSPTVDLALQGKLGVWSAPEGAPSPIVPAAAVGVGLRITLSTDLLHAPHRGSDDGPR